MCHIHICSENEKKSVQSKIFSSNINFIEQLDYRLLNDDLWHPYGVSSSRILQRSIFWIIFFHCFWNKSVYKNEQRKFFFFWIIKILEILKKKETKIIYYCELWAKKMRVIVYMCVLCDQNNNNNKWKSILWIQMMMIMMIYFAEPYCVIQNWKEKKEDIQLRVFQIEKERFDSKKDIVKCFYLFFFFLDLFVHLCVCVWVCAIFLLLSLFFFLCLQTRFF